MSFKVVDGMITSVTDLKVTEIIIPARIIHTIGPNAFAQCTGLKTIVFQEPSAVKSIESGAFSGCSSLCMLQLPQSLEMIWDNAFRGCVELTTIAMPPQLLFVGNAIFNACMKLEQVAFPSSLRFIDRRVLYNCPHLRRVRIPRNARVISAQGESEVIAPNGCQISLV
jgi:hypothetical protein